jgi:hypothetical protein
MMLACLPGFSFAKKLYSIIEAFIESILHQSKFIKKEENQPSPPRLATSTNSFNQSTT